MEFPKTAFGPFCFSFSSSLPLGEGARGIQKHSPFAWAFDTKSENH